VLWFRWPLFLVGFACSIYGGAIAMMFYFAWAAKPADDALLDAEGVRALGTILAERPGTGTAEGTPLSWFEYEFEAERQGEASGGDKMRGQSLAPSGTFAVGVKAVIEYLRLDSTTSRLAGTRISHLSTTPPRVTGTVFTVGLLAFAAWLYGVLRLRRLLEIGDVAVAEVLAIEQLRLVQPTMLRVRYRFRDRHAKGVVGHHWVRARSALGAKLVEVTPTTAPVVHSRHRPRWNRLVTADNFFRPAAAADGLRGEAAQRSHGEP
jgi:hypothetical protein